MAVLEQATRARIALADFAAVSLDQHFQGRRAEPLMHVMALARQVAAEVPAYRAFLLDAGISIAQLQAPADFAALPLTGKANYIQRYPLHELCRLGRLESCDMVAVSSGSTGSPGFWPRFVSDEYLTARRFEQVFVDAFNVQRHRTLAVVCFAMGSWVGGMYSAACCRHLAAKGLPVTVVTPGNNPTEIGRVVKALAPLFEQTVLLGYPPFIKDAVDAGRKQGIDWASFNTKLVLAGEVFSEEWRALMYSRFGYPSYLHASASLYGTADAGVLANETPLSICIRRYLAATPGAARQLFGDSRLPSLLQYDPWSRYFETIDGTLLFSGDNGIPLIRYHIADEGGLVSYDAMLSFLRDWGFDPFSDPDLAVSRALPFVYVFGRSHFVVSFYGANIYPENVTVGLEQPGVQEWVTGKFVLQVRHDSERNPRLHILVELAPDAEASAELGHVAADSIVAQLCRLNSEFAHYVPEHSRLPVLEFRTCGDPEWFPVGVKHRYTRKPITDESDP